MPFKYLFNKCYGLSYYEDNIENVFAYNSGVNGRKMRALWQTRLKFCIYEDIRISIQILLGDTFVE